ncbi:hypothetical protein IC582_009253 [Cucumis melo]|uniref:Uncharacterized protein At5g41620 n=2 Tax=Cucumis melo TaxID=3656 RepID=A0A1S3B697_CUCME|nr:uncharacterized protein At5g41620 [Cucumis melo]KAA0043849.1 uncharacterized protein E6C27_scaffold236G001840 [Cucumis melo var. makuwa]TYK25286.1 uncharacterized protein E5676_scaffold352G004220 [Cucumis melo var. makuwa]
MPRQNLAAELIPGKIRKRGCSSSASSSSSILHNYRFKRAILVGKRAGSSTPLPSWRLMSSRSRSPASAFRSTESPNYELYQCGSGRSKQAPVSARKLAATLWEMNELPSTRVKESLALDERKSRKEMKAREKTTRSVHSGSLPPHLSDPSHSPVSERGDRSGTGSRCRRTPSMSQRLKLADHGVGVLDSVSNASLMEIETRSRAPTPSASIVGVKTRLKDVSSALTTSKELLKIINRVWGHEDRPSTSMSLISALHAELERARLQINQLIQEQRYEQSDISYLMRCFAEEKEAWKNKEQEVVEAAIESVAGELEVERKLRRRFESLNKKLGRELAETKSSLLKVVKELESEKRAREIMEQVCDDLANDVGDDKLELGEMQRESAKLCDNVKKEREMKRLAAALHEEQTHIDASDKYDLEDKNAAVDKLRNQLESFLGIKRAKEKEFGSNDSNEVKFAAYLNKNGIRSFQCEEKEEGEVVDGVECEEDLAESDLHSIELNVDNNNKSYDWIHSSGIPLDTRRPSIDDEPKARKSTSKKGSRKSTSIQRSISDGVEWGNQADNHPILGDHVLDWERSSVLEKVASGKVYGDHFPGYNSSSKNLRDQILSGSRLGSLKVTASPTRLWEQARPLRDLADPVTERASMVQGSNGLKSRLMEVRGDGLGSRKYK